MRFKFILMQGLQRLNVLTPLRLLIIALLFAVNATPGYSNPVSGGVVTRSLLQSHPIAGTNQELREYLITYPPGASAPVHHHPVVGMGMILDGTAESQFEGEDLKTFHAGDSFQDLAITKHVIFRNPDSNKPLRFVIFYLTKLGDPVMETDAP